jgi:hypothetical protein
MAISSLTNQITESHPRISVKISPYLSEALRWQSATWGDYLSCRDDESLEIMRLFFNLNQIFIEMGQEGITHAKVSDLFIFLLVFWFSLYPEIQARK